MRANYVGPDMVLVHTTRGASQIKITLAGLASPRWALLMLLMVWRRLSRLVAAPPGTRLSPPPPGTR